MTKKIKVTSVLAKRVDPKVVAKALGAEKVEDQAEKLKWRKRFERIGARRISSR